jgi:peptidoglycan hydrolase CwlO-like protein
MKNNREIINAFKICNKNMDCFGCPLITDCPSAERLSEMMVDVATSQEDEIEGLILGQETLQKYIAKLNKELERANAKFEKQEAEIKKMRDSIASPFGEM